MERWNIKIYNKYVQPFFAWFMTEFGIPWGLLGLGLAMLVTSILDNKYYFSNILIFIFPISGLLIGLYQRSIDVMLLSPSAIWVTRDGIYGKNMFERFFRYTAKPRLLARWEEIERVELKKYPFNLSKNTGYAEFFKKDGTRFHISYHGFCPVSKGFYNAEWKILCNETDRTICTELFGIIAWKIGLNKFKNFPEKELKALNGVRKRTMSIEGIRRVVQSIEGHGREELPYKKMDEEWAKEEKGNKNGQEAK